MSRRLSARVRGLDESATCSLHDRVQALRRQGRTLLDLGAGDPDFDTPAHIGRAAIAAIEAGLTHYTPSRGLPELLQAIATKLRDENGLTVEPSQVLATPSAKHALFVAVMTVVDPGDEVIIPTPSWVSYKSMVQLAGGTAVEMPLRAEDGYRLSIDALEARWTPRTKAVLVNSPNNPTGRVMDAAENEAVAAFAQQHDLIVISDEIYERMVYRPHRHVSIATLPAAQDRTIVVNGFSKAFAMTGWRLGYLAGPRDLVDAALKVHQHTVSCAGSFVQAGGIAALRGDPEPVRLMHERYAGRARRVSEALRACAGVRCMPPQGGLYVFADVSGAGHGDGDGFAEWLLAETGVVVTPGSAFGGGGQHCVRLALTATDTVLDEAMKRMLQALSSPSSAMQSTQDAAA